MFISSIFHVDSGDPSSRGDDHVNRRVKSNVLMGLAVAGTITWVTSNKLRWNFPKEAMLLRAMSLFFLTISIPPTNPMRDSQETSGYLPNRSFFPVVKHP